MEDDLGQGSGGGVSESEPLAENDNTGSGSWVDDSYKEGDDGGEIMVEIVGSDVFVDGVGGGEEGDLEPAEENKREDEEESEVAFSGAMDVSHDRVENKTGEVDLRLLESKDEKNHVEDLGVSGEGGESKMKGSELGSPDSRGENNNVSTGENKDRESELGLPELNDEKNKSELGFSQLKEENNNVVTSENKMGESELRLVEPEDEKNQVFTEGIYAAGETKMGESESGLPDLSDEKVHDVTEAMDVCEGGENKTKETELGLSKSKEVKINYFVTEDIDVLDEVSEGKVGGSKLVVLEEKGEKENHVIITEEIDNEHMNVEVGTFPVQTEEDTVTTFMASTENKIVKGEAAFEKEDSSQIVPSKPNSEGPVNVGVDSDTEIVQVVIHEEETVKDEEAVGEKDTKKQDHSDSYDGGIALSEVSPKPSGEGPESEKSQVVGIVNAIVTSETAIGERITTKDETVDEKTCKDPHQDLCNAEVPGNVHVDGVDNVVREEPKSFDDSRDTVLESNHEKATHEEVDAVLDFKDGEYGFDTDLVNKDENEKVLDGDKSSEKVEKIVSEEAMQGQEKDEIPNNVENCCLSESKEQAEASLIITESSDHLVEEFDNNDLIPSQVVNVEPVSDTSQVSILPEITEKSEIDLSFDSNTVSLGEIDRKIESETIEVNSEIGKEESSHKVENSKLPKEVYLRLSQQGYFPPPEIEGHFSISDLVWGKVRSHPWWPGQIFDPAEASEIALKHYKKDSYLVAYFGDRTFAWNDSSLLKPLRAHFSEIEKQSNSEAFQNAVDSALEEVSRRVELGLVCSCIPKEVFCKIEAQNVENAGIREESSNRYGLDHSASASSFEPDKFLDYIRNMATVAISEINRLELVIAKAQLSSFYRSKGYRSLTEFIETDEEKIAEDSVTVTTASHKRKERSLMELMGPDEKDSFGKKQKSVDSLTDGYDSRVSICHANVSTQNTPKSKPSFKIGECIRRVASQLTGSTGKDEMMIDDSKKNPESQSMVLSIESFSVDEMLSQLEQVSQQPKKGHSFLNTIHTFFIGFRSSIAPNRKRRPEHTAAGGPTEGFEFDEPVGNFQALPIVQEKPTKPIRRRNSRKRFSDVMINSEIEDQAKRKKQASSPAELILNFAEKSCIPTEINLNKMFRRFGALMESETEVDHNSGCAKVIFKRGSDAEVARSSSEAFNVFGPVLVSYRIGYEPVVSIRVSPVKILMPQEDMISIQ